MTQSLTIRRPDDWHLHLRDGAMLQGVLPESARHFARAIIMPNLVPPVVTGDQAAAYRDRILAALPNGMVFEPLMTLYLTETTDPADVAAAHASGLVKAVKLYPAGATTNSHGGVRDLSKVTAVLEKMAEIGLPLCLHGEVTEEMVQSLQNGVQLDDGPAAFSVLESMDSAGGSNEWWRVVIKEGRNREVRRLWEAVGLQVSRLKRASFIRSPNRDNIFFPFG